MTPAGPLENPRCLFALALLMCALLPLCFLPAARAQNLDKPLQSIDEEITAFAYAPDGRLVYSVYRRVKTKVYDALVQNDIWVQDAAGKRRRILARPNYTSENQSLPY